MPIISQIRRTIHLRQKKRRSFFDFSDGALPHGVSYLRPGPANRFGSHGVFDAVAANVPPFTWDRLTHRCGLLFEPAATNMRPYSDDVSKSPPYYSANNNLIQVDYRTIAEPAVTAISNLQCPFAFVKGQRNFFSIEANWRPGGVHRYLLFILARGSFGPLSPLLTVRATFDLAAGTMVLTTNGRNPIPDQVDFVAGMTRVATTLEGLPIWRCWAGATSWYQDDLNSHFDWAPSALNNGTGGTYAGDGFSGFQIAHLQAERDRMTAPIQTGPAPASRAAPTMRLHWRGVGIARRHGTISAVAVMTNGERQRIRLRITNGYSTIDPTIVCGTISRIRPRRLRGR